MKAFVPLIIVVSTGWLAAQSSQVKTCAQISLARPGFGVSYRGVVRNDDYKFSLTVPEGLAGWGADPVAPFHGFTIFLPDQSSCIMFEIHLRIDLGQRDSMHRGAKVMIGDVTAWKEETTGKINGTEFANVTIRFSVAHGQEVNDGTVRLVTPTKDIGRNRRIFEEFLSQIKFDHQ